MRQVNTHIFTILVFFSAKQNLNWQLEKSRKNNVEGQINQLYTERQGLSKLFKFD